MRTGIKAHVHILTEHNFKKITHSLLSEVTDYKPPPLLVRALSFHQQVI